MGDSQGQQRTSAWSFGSFVKSLTAKSEEVLQAYQRDLEEFGIGLKKETTSAAVVTAQAVKELPISLESTAAVAQESLEAVGQTLEEFGSSVWRGTAELIGQVKEAVKKVDEDSSESPKPGETPLATRYSRHEAQLNALQCDSSTYCDEPEDQEDYTSWKTTFELDDRQDEIQSLLEENPFVQELHARIVPADVDHQTFWMRYFYHLKKLQQAEDARADLVKRANAVEEDLSWEVDEDNGTNPEPAAPTTSVSPVSAKEVAVEDETRSDNSTSSDWLVVQEDKDSLNSESEQAPDPKAQTSSEKSTTDTAAKEEDWGEWE